MEGTTTEYASGHTMCGGRDFVWRSNIWYSSLVTVRLIVWETDWLSCGGDMNGMGRRTLYADRDCQKWRIAMFQLK